MLLMASPLWVVYWFADRWKPSCASDCLSCYCHRQCLLLYTNTALREEEGGE